GRVRTMNILLLTTHMNIGGISLYVVGLAKRLKRKGHRVIVSSSGGDLCGELDKEGIPHVRLNIKTKSELSPKLLLALPKLLSLVDKGNIEIVHAHTRVTQVLSAIVSCLRGIAYVTTCHGFFKMRLGRRIFKCWGDKAIAISDAVRDHLIKDLGAAPDKTELVYNGIDAARFSVELSAPERESLKKELGLRPGRIIGAIGRLSSVKGYSYLLEAFAELLSKYKDMQLLIVGDGPEKEDLHRRCRGLKIENSVKIIESRLDTPRILSIMDIFVSSSVQEGLGLSLAEAMASRKPVVATDVGGVRSLVKDRETGLLVPSKDSGKIAEAVSALIADPALMKELGSMGRTLIERDFNIDHMTDKIIDIYRGAVAAKMLKMERVLIVNVNWLGDVLFTTPFIRAIRGRFPSSHIACLVVPRCKDLLEGNPNVNEVIIYDEDGLHKSLIGKLKLIAALRRKRFDGAFVLHRSFTRALLMYLSGIKNRIGYNTKKRGFLLTKAVDEPIGSLHKVEYFLDLARACGADANAGEYDFIVRDQERRDVGEFLKKKGISGEDTLIVLNPGGNWPPKRWPKESFAELSDRLSDELNAKVLITGAPSDMKLAHDIMALANKKPVSAAGKTTLKSLGAVMERADLMISSDSGPMHLALSVKSKVIALFGPTSDAITGPYGNRNNFYVIKKDIDCEVPCYDFTCRDHRCMKAITVDEVLAKAKEILGVKTHD
ncbi:MAG: lipopolysaccharide heptosyltransferase II, partial [Candidatus Omnitrophota bacterium]